MKIILHNPNKIWFLNTIASFKNKTKSVNKYDYLIDWLIKSEHEIYCYLDSSHPSNIFEGILRIFNSNQLDFKYWLKINKIRKTKIKVINTLNNLEKDDFIISFTYGHYNYSNMDYIKIAKSISKKFNQANCKKIFHLSHFGYNTNSASNYCKLSNTTALVCETNLKNSSKIYNQYFNWFNKDVIQLPYVPEKRFQNHKRFVDRNNLALATGTLTYPIEDQGFHDIYDDGILQPMRKIIFENKEKLIAYIDCQISDIRDKDKKDKVGFQSNNLFLKIGKVIPNTFRDITLLYKIYFMQKNIKENKLSGERSYYKIDIVQTYNDYKMFVCPEEIIGIPGIGFVEGMACGTAYIGLNSSIYKDYGMVDKKHYVAYDGTLNDLVSKIRYYQKHNSELKEIAHNGQKFVEKYFNPEFVAEKFIKSLESLPN
jgi:glycosyltransferase involved in cell wall biosynthesis